MIPRWLPLALCAVFFAPGFLRAQQEPVANNATRLFKSDALPSNDKMYEDIEILRRILDRKLHSHYVRHQYQSPDKINLNTIWQTPQGSIHNNLTPYLLTQTNNPGVVWSPDKTQLWLYQQNATEANKSWAELFAGPITQYEAVSPTLEGVYLKGQGVLYTATLTSLQPAAKTETAKPVSEWESVRRQVRNEKEEPKKAEANKSMPLSDVLLKVLAENGHHFSQLGENESLTIVLTVHEPSPPVPARTSKGAGGSAKTDTKSASSGGSDLRGKIRDLELLGDLHMKQGQHEEAIAAFQKAVELQPGPKEAAGMYRKLAQCYLAREKIDSARAALDHYAEFLKSAQAYNEILKNAQEAGNPKSKPSTSKPSAPALPTKLIISVPKKLLEEAKEGKLAFEEIRRRAHVETLRFGDHR